ncbi:hypothetical protein DFP72DRAFT_1175078 [Ephemerocybe angulata]|uniref:Uncharacterized protein n=1 Tax=Ephemerocybe angulata TaxID=980116 RepID=A0A8H6LZY9_9AGAR|nr:hypothetical protein DFP72DRAFT_1175078 [Tulosesus angulatus]
MPAKSWMSPPQKGLFKARLEKYNDAHEEGPRAIMRFWPEYEDEFFTDFPMLKELVGKEQLGKHVLEKGYELSTEEKELYKKAMTKRCQQIKNQFRYLHKRKYGGVGVGVGDGTRGTARAVSRAAKAFVTSKKRASKRVEIFHRLNQSWLDGLISKAMAEYTARKKNGEKLLEYAEDENEEGEGDGEVNEQNKDDAEDDEEGSAVGGGETVAQVEPTTQDGETEAKKQGWNLKVRSEVLLHKFGKASEDDLKQVELAVTQERERLEKEADLRRSGSGLAREAHLRQDALSRVEAFMVENGRLMWDYCAMTTITIGIVPDPNNPKRLITRVVGYGKNSEDKLFIDVHQEFAKQAALPLKQWARTNIYGPDAWTDAQAKHQKYLDKMEGQSGKDSEKCDTPALSAEPSATVPIPDGGPIAQNSVVDTPSESAAPPEAEALTTKDSAFPSPPSDLTAPVNPATPSPGSPDSISLNPPRAQPILDRRPTDRSIPFRFGRANR